MPLSRRRFVNSALAASGASTLGLGLGPGGVAGTGVPAARADAWPSAADWAGLREKVGGRLVAVASPLAPCEADPAGAACAARLEDMANPFYIQDQPGAQQTNGWLDAWTAEISPYAVAAQSPADVAAAIAFARAHGVKLVIKGAGHDYLGRNCAADSLLVWTGRMREVRFDPAFRISGGPASDTGVPAVIAQAGARWIEVYTAASRNGRYVQGGGCTTVGAAGGFIQGGGYGSFSKRYGSGAGGVLEFEVVTADGRVLIANSAQNSDLFWALRGGGGGTFGVVTRVALRAHEPPQTLGLMQGSIKTANDAAFKDLIARFVAFYPGALNNPHWGEQVAIRTDNSFEIFMTFLDLDESQARAVWQPLLDALPEETVVDLKFETHPFSGMWDLDYWKKTDPDFARIDTRPDALPDHYWWATNQGEVSEFINTYQSRWLPAAFFEPANAEAFAQVLFDASRHARVAMHFNKGLSGAPADVLAREAETSINPLVRDAATLVIIASKQAPTFPGIAGHEPDLAKGRAAATGISAAMKILREATPGGGTYANEADYFEPDWQSSFYGVHYDRLLEIKRKYDPDNLFRVHHGVGSEV